MLGGALAISLLLAACGDSDSGVASLETTDSGGEATSETVAAADSEEELLAFVECMRQEGIDLPDPTVDAEGNLTLGGGPGARNNGDGEGPGGGGVDAEAFQAASDACGGVPESVTAGFSDADLTEFEDNLLEFTQCLRDGGLDVDDPDLSGLGSGEGPGAGGGPFAELDLDDPEVSAVFEDCQALLADAFPGGTADAEADE